MEKIKIQISQINPTVADIDANSQKITHEFLEAGKAKCDLVICPEMCLTGYPIDDIILWPILDSKIDPAIKKLVTLTKKHPNTGLIFGTPYIEDGKKYNSAILAQNGKIIHLQHKHELPNYGVFDEKRLFESGPLPNCFMYKGVKIGLMICEDLWLNNVPNKLSEENPDLFISLNGSPYYYGHFVNRLRAIQKTTEKHDKTFIYVNQIGTQDELVFDGHSFVVSNNRILKVLKGFREDRCIFTFGKKHPTVVKIDDYILSIDKNKFIYKSLTLGVRDFFAKNGIKKAVIGLSGGVDSALTTLLAVDALGVKNVKCIMMPSPYTSEDSINDAAEFCKNLGLKLDTIKISEAYEHFKALLAPGLFKTFKDTTDQNIQARIRGLILMACSNQEGRLLLTTGNKSELAVGYCTLYGDMCGAYNPLKDVYKTQVYELCHWRNRNIPKMDNVLKKKDLIPLNILVKKPTAELKSGQKDEDSLPEYSVLDSILIDYIDAKLPMKTILKKHDSKALVEKIIAMIHKAEFKRFQACPGPKVGPSLFGKDWRWPITFAD